MKGSYILLVKLANSRNISTGKLGYISFPRGFYAYIGSAMKGLEARLARHLRKEKKLHWHIDYLLKEANIRDIILCPGGQKAECSLAQILAKEFQSIPGFGSSDCKCKSHLYFGNEKDLKVKVMEAVDQAGLGYKIFSKEEEKWQDLMTPLKGWKNLLWGI